MHVIIYSKGMQSVRSFDLRHLHIGIALAVFFAVAALMAVLFGRVSGLATHPHDTVPLLAQTAMQNVQDQHNKLKNEQQKQHSLQLMASRLGEMQARMLEMESLSQRLASLAGVKVPSAKESKQNRSTAGKKAAQGGPLEYQLSETELRQAIEDVSLDLEASANALQNLEPLLLDKRIQRRLLPTSKPIPTARISSGFGYRKDPFLGVAAFHKGVDYSVPTGTRVYAAARGVVKSAKYHRAYGRTIEIDHGNNTVTKYAHLARIKVQPGQLVKRGEYIALSGNTGRSTGAHLHFEVLVNNVPQNPARFLKRGSKFSKQIVKHTKKLKH